MHDVLEIGGGHGVAATRVLERLTTGRFVGVDRSAKMVDASRQRNADAIAVGRARFLEGTILRLDDAVGDERFDRVLAVRVAPLCNADELAVVARHLRPAGAIVLAFDSPDDDRTARLAERATAAAATVGLSLGAAPQARIDGAFVVCLRFGSTARPGPAH